MPTPKNKSDILSDSIVFDYVAGHLSDEVRARFEDTLKNDESLQRAVETERRLRIVLLESEQGDLGSFTVGAGNIDTLLATLDEPNIAPTAGWNGEKESSRRVTSFWSNSTWFALAGAAASIAVAAILFIEYLPKEATPGFALLRDDVDSRQIDFNAMIAAQKVAQIWLVNDISPAELSALFSEYGLTPIGRADRAWIVASAQALSPSRLMSLREVDKFKEVSLISYKNHVGAID